MNIRLVKYFPMGKVTQKMLFCGQSVAEDSNK